jgi:hypothetical protein
MGGYAIESGRIDTPLGARTVEPEIFTDRHAAARKMAEVAERWRRKYAAMPRYGSATVKILTFDPAFGPQTAQIIAGGKVRAVVGIIMRVGVRQF